MKPYQTLFHRLLAGLLLTWSALGFAEQKLEFDGYELDYVVIPASFLSAEVAKRYGLVRGKGRALVNLSLLKDGVAVRAQVVSGTVKNLLSQQQTLEFDTVVEGDAIYYLAQLRHSDRDTLTFNLSITPPGQPARALTFQQKLYADGIAVNADNE